MWMEQTELPRAPCHSRNGYGLPMPQSILQLSQAISSITSRLPGEKSMKTVAATSIVESQFISEDGYQSSIH
ncbi:hypothetical protein NC652_023421 [Populus alba x Populus x berolinensis]|nr:hypothetical protein NC652_023421 [Populus alba x Populus x berolinensis]